MGLNLGPSGFSVIKIVICHVRVLPEAKRCTAHEDCECVCLAFIFACMVSNNQKTPKFSPVADEAITQGGIGGLGSLVYSCGILTIFWAILAFLHFIYTYLKKKKT